MKCLIKHNYMPYDHFHIEGEARGPAITTLVCTKCGKSIIKAHDLEADWRKNVDKN